MTGSGTEGDPYIIYNVNDLQAIQDHLAAWYELGNDIDASETVDWNEGAGFDPVEIFTGHFDGKGHKITDLYINRPGENYIGLFGQIGSYADIKNVALENVNISGGRYTGALVGRLGTGSTDYGTVSKCYSTGTVNGNPDVGGLIGRILQKGTVSDCYSTCTVVGGSGYDFGGFVGSIYGTIEKCYSIGNVSGEHQVGGFSGKFYVGSVTDCFWDTEASGNPTSYSGTGKTTAEMKQQATFTNWDFDTIWDIEENITYPSLIIFAPPPPPPEVSIPANPKAYNGYLCFMEQYIKNKVADLPPLKLPDGTLWD